MFLVDNLLLAPGKALFFVLQELARKAQEEWLDDDSIKKELQEIYTLLDAGQIGDKEFESRECQLLQRLEQIAKVKFQQKWGNDTGLPVASAALPAPVVIDADTPRPAPAELNAIAGDDAAVAITPAPDPPEAAESAFGMGILQALRPLLNQVQSAAAAEAEPGTAPAYTIESATSVRPLFETEIQRAAPPTEPPALLEPKASSTVDTACVPGERLWQVSAPAAENKPPEIRVSGSPAIQSEPAKAASTSTAPPQGNGNSTTALSEAPPRTIGMSEVVESAIRSLSLTRLKVSSVTSVAKAEDGWRVGIELVERASVPDTSDLLGVYEVRLDPAGIVTRYERTRVRRRNDLSR